MSSRRRRCASTGRASPSTGCWTRSAGPTSGPASGRSVMVRTPEQLWEPIARDQLARRGVTGGTGFGTNEGLRVSGKIFAMLVRGELVVKLPRDRVDELVEAGAARRFDAGKGRPMKEWASVPASASRRWRGLVEEARTFVG